jgi:hypothetical protein
MPGLIDTIEGNKIAGHRPWPRVVVDEDGWRFAASQLSAGYWTLLGLWGDTGAVHMAVLDASMREIAVVTLPCPDARFPSVGALHPPAIRLERALRDLYGLEPVGLPNTRPWLDLGFWNVQYPLGQRRDAPPRPTPYAFLPAAGEGLHQTRRRARVDTTGRRPASALSPARPVLVSMAAAGSRDRGQHRRGLPTVQQIVQLLLFRSRSLGQPCAEFSSRVSCAAP